MRCSERFYYTESEERKTIMIDTGMLDELLESLLLVSGGGLKIEDIASHLEN